MSLIIKYNLVRILKDYNEPYSIFKVVKHNIRDSKINISAFCGTAFFFDCLSPLYAAPVSVLAYVLANLLVYCPDNMKGKDPYKDAATETLKNLCPYLKDEMGVDTNIYKMKDPEIERKGIISFRTRKKRIPWIASTHHVLIHSFDELGRDQEVTICQTHPVFSRKYILSRKNKGVCENQK